MQWRSALLAAALVYLQGFWMHPHPYFAIAGGGCLLAAGLGENPGAMTRNVSAMSDRTSGAIWRLLPQGAMQWRLVSVLVAFLLLGLGVLRSLRQLGKRLAKETG